MIKEVSLKGHPLFFYILLFPFAKAGFSVFAMQFLCWISSAAAVYLLHAYSPFPFLLNFLITVSAPFLYFFPVIARSYSIIPFLLFLSACFYSSRREKPLLYLLPLAAAANTHFIMTGFAFILFMFFYHENFIKEKAYSGKAARSIIEVIALSIVVPAAQIIFAVMNNDFFSPSYKGAFLPITYFFVSFFENLTPYFANNEYVLPLSILSLCGGAAVILLLCFILHKLYAISAKLFYAAMFSLAYQLAAYSFFYPLVYPMRVFCFHCILLFCFWCGLQGVKEDKAKAISALNWNQKSSLSLLKLLFFITIPSGLYFAFGDCMHKFSSAPEMAAFINNNVSESDYVFASTDFMESLVLALGERKILFSRGEPLSFSRNEYILKDTDLYNYATPGRKVFLLLWEKEETQRYNLIYSAESALKWKEDYYLVQIYPETEHGY